MQLAKFIHASAFFHSTPDHDVAILCVNIPARKGNTEEEDLMSFIENDHI